MQKMLDAKQIHKPDGILPISQSCWKTWVRNGKVPAPTKLGRRALWPAEVIERLCREGMKL